MTLGLTLGLGGALATGASALTGMFLVSRGRIYLDLGWGRSLHALGPITVEINAPRNLVFEQISSPYLGQTPAGLRSKLRVLERASDLAVAEHRTKLPLMDAVTVEAVHFEPPGRISFRLLQGPVPHVSEEFLLEEVGSGTALSYQGELGADLWLLGRIYGGSIVRPAWERTVAASLDDIRKGAEQRAAARRRRTTGES